MDDENIPPPRGWKIQLKQALEKATTNAREIVARFRKKSPTEGTGPTNFSFKNAIERTKEITREISKSLTKENIRQTFNKEKWKQRIQNFEPAAAYSWANQAIQKRDAGFYGKAATIVLSTYFLADLSALTVGSFIPDPPANHGARPGINSRRMKMIDDYNVIFSRNLFNSKGLIPGEGGPVDTGGPTNMPDLNGPPTKTTLPFNLIGLLILNDDTHSIATIEDKSASVVYPVRIQDEIPSKAKIVRIEPRRVIFINMASGRPEYVELPDEAPPVDNPRITPGAKTTAIEKVSPTQFSIARSEVDRSLSDLNNILTQARAVPNFVNGMPAGYKLFQIVPGSIYDKLGLQNGDVISGLNGQPINDPGKAFEMLSELKTAQHLELQVQKNGASQQTYSYDIHP